MLGEVVDEELADLGVGVDFVGAVGESVAFVFVEEVGDGDVFFAEAGDDAVGAWFGDAAVVGALGEEHGGVDVGCVGEGGAVV